MSPDAAGSLEAESQQKKKKKRDKVRSAWISFTGRIIAQIVGALATVVALVANDRPDIDPAAPRAYLIDSRWPVEGLAFEGQGFAFNALSATGR
mgnify:CR=1 FL=1